MVSVYADTVNLILPVGVVHCTVHTEKFDGFRTIFLDIVEELVSVHHLDGIGILLEGNASAVAYVDSFACSFLGGDDDHTVGSA